MTDTRRERAPGWVPDLKEFGARLALLRQAMHWGNVATAAKQCGISVETWRTWERDEMTPRQLVNVCMKISGVTGIDLDWLLRGPKDPAATSAQMAEGTTLRYAALGERVVIVGMADRLPGLPPNDRQARTRPIIRSLAASVSSV